MPTKTNTPESVLAERNVEEGRNLSLHRIAEISYRYSGSWLDCTCGAPRLTAATAELLQDQWSEHRNIRPRARPRLGCLTRRPAGQYRRRRITRKPA